MMSTPSTRLVGVFVIVAITMLGPPTADASHISGIRIVQTGGADLEVEVDVTAFYTTGSTASSAYLGTYYNQIPALDWGDGSTEPRYGGGPSTGIPLVATSTTVNGVVARAYRGSFSHTYGAVGEYTISANTRCCPVTTPTYPLVSGEIVVTTVATTGVFGPTTFTTSFVRNTLDVHATMPPGFAKAFAPDTVAAGAPSTLTFTIDNSGNTTSADSLDFTDVLPAGLDVATPPNIVDGCGGTTSAVSGSDTISHSGGSAPAAGTCSISVDVVALGEGTYDNVSGDLTSSLGSSGTASASLTVTSVDSDGDGVLDGIDQCDGTVIPEGVPTVRLGTNRFALTDGDDIFDTTPPNGGGPGASFTLQDTAGCSCEQIIDALGLGQGHVKFGCSLGAMQNWVALVGASADLPPSFSSEFAPSEIAPDGSTTLVYTIENLFSSQPATGLAFTNTLPSGMTIRASARAPANDCGGTLTAIAGTGTIELAGGSVGAGASCSIAVDVEVSGGGPFDNSPSALSSSLGSSPAGEADASLIVRLPAIDVPTVSTLGVALLAALLGLLGFVVLRRTHG